VCVRRGQRARRRPRNTKEAPPGEATLSSTTHAPDFKEVTTMISNTDVEDVHVRRLLHLGVGDGNGGR
jgi:hypothetical protein